MFYDQERLHVRPKICAVRDFLNASGYLEMNPFLCAKGVENITPIMQEIAGDVEQAALKLHSLTGVAVPDFKETLGYKYLADGLKEIWLREKKDLEVFLSETFIRAASVPYFALERMEREKIESANSYQKAAEVAMDGMTHLHAVVSVIPLMYKQEECKRAPACALA
jgi:hypothetical protein